MVHLGSLKFALTLPGSQEVGGSNPPGSTLIISHPHFYIVGGFLFGVIW